jgi:hypothetical protein
MPQQAAGAFNLEGPTVGGVGLGVQFLQRGVAHRGMAAGCAKDLNDGEVNIYPLPARRLFEDTARNALDNLTLEEEGDDKDRDCRQNRHGRHVAPLQVELV